MGWKTTAKNREMQEAWKIYAIIPDELIGSVHSLALKNGGGVLIGQNRANTALSFTLYEAGERNPPQYANTDDEAMSIVLDLYDYLHQKVKGEPAPEASRSIVRTKP